MLPIAKGELAQLKLIATKNGSAQYNQYYVDPAASGKMLSWWRSPVADGSNPFADVATGRFYSQAVLWAVESGITSGMDATHFKPDQGCTRGQAVTFLYRNYTDE